MKSDKRLKLAIKLDKLYTDNDEVCPLYELLHKTYSEENLKYLIACKEEELNYLTGE